MEGLMDAPKYISILQENLEPSIEKLGIKEDFVFQQDNDPKHKSTLAQSYFEKHDIKVMDWPSQSPDLNVIEHVWAHVKRKYSSSPASSKKEVLDKILKIWEEIPSKFIQDLINSIYERLSEVIRSKGNATRY
jgi:DDE superfamily endonuclease